tara:strand:+ start:144 stop:635 length:492 start_codon:yes stop_codon:yes gene_type:complete
MTCETTQDDGFYYRSCYNERLNYYIETHYSGGLVGHQYQITGVMIVQSKSYGLRRVYHWQETKIPIGYKVDPEFWSENICVYEDRIVVTASVLVPSFETATKDFAWYVPMSLSADINNDGSVNGEDLGMIYADWGTGVSRSDLNRDGIVDGADIGLLAIAWTG